MVWPFGHDIVPCGHGMVYGMAWRGLALYRKWPSGHGMAYDMA